MNVMWEYLFINSVYLCPSLSVPVEECSYWLPLYGSMCCRLAAQPHCMTQQMMSGCLKVKVGWQVFVQHWWGNISLKNSIVFDFFALTYFCAFLPLYFILFLLMMPSVFVFPSLTRFTDLFLYLTAVWRWPSELDKSVRSSERNKPFLLPPARRCGG